MKKLGFGTMRLPTLGDDSKVDPERFKEMVDRFLEQGFTYFDTSYVYHGGMSESALKEALVDRHPRDHFTITTKLPVFLVKEKADVRRFFQEQLTRLGTDYVDYYWLHAVNAATYETAKQTDAFGELAALKSEGLTRHIGLSFHDSAEVLDRILKEHPEMEYVQLQLNYFDWESNSVQARKCYEVCVKHGKQIVVMEPVKGGSLAKLPEELEQIYRREQPGLSTASWAVRFAASLENVLVVLSGMSNMEQVEDNTSYMKDFQPLSDVEQDAVKQVAAALRSKTTVDCTACGACLKQCPQHIPMPAYFDMYNEHCQMNKYTNGMVYYANFPAGTGKASACDGCGKCEAVCPQKLPIRELLKEVKGSFEM